VGWRLGLLHISARSASCRAFGWHNPSLEGWSRCARAFGGRRWAKRRSWRIVQRAWPASHGGTQSLDPGLYDGDHHSWQATGHASQAAKLVDATRQGLDRVSAKTARLPEAASGSHVAGPGNLRDLYTATDGSFTPPDRGCRRAHRRAPNERDTQKLKRGSAGDQSRRHPGLYSRHEKAACRRSDGRVARDTGLKAVRDGCSGLSEDYVPHASQRIVLDCRALRQLIHPEAK